jgi:hypothetical protein
MELKKIISCALPLVLGAALSLETVHAEMVETKSQEVTPTGVTVNTTHVQGIGSDDLAVGDPYRDGPLSEQADKGPAITWQPYPTDCQEPRCLRAQQRQLSSPYWRAE